MAKELGDAALLRIFYLLVAIVILKCRMVLEARGEAEIWRAGHASDLHPAPVDDCDDASARFDARCCDALVVLAAATIVVGLLDGLREPFEHLNAAHVPALIGPVPGETVAPLRLRLDSS